LQYYNKAIKIHPFLIYCLCNFHFKQTDKKAFRTG